MVPLVKKRKIFTAAILGIIVMCVTGKTFAAFAKKSSGGDNASVAQLPYLAEAAANAKEHEVLRVFGYPAGNIRHIKTNNTFIIPTSLRFESWVNLWRVNADGLIVDSFVPSGDYEGNLPNSGIYFRKENYIDWAFSGDKMPKSYLKTIDSKQVTKEHLRKMFSQAQQIVWKRETIYENIYRGSKETNEFRYFLKSAEGWSLLLSPEQLEINEYPELSVALNDYYLKGYEGPELLVKLLDSITFDVKDAASPMRLLAFKKMGESKSGFMDINSSAWIGDFGYGHFQLVAGNEQIHFKSFHRILKSNRGSDDKENHQPDMFLYDVAKNSLQQNGLMFLVLETGRAPSRDDDELGTYLIRKKTPAPLTSTLTKSEHEYVKHSLQTTPLNIRVKGFEFVEHDLHWMTYFNGGSESFAQNNTVDIPSKPRGMPMELRASFDFPSITKKDGKTDNRHYSYAIKINEQYFSRSDANDLHFALHFDFDEMVKIYKQLSPANQPMVLSLNAEFVKGGVDISLLLSNATQTVAIKNIRFASVGGQDMSKDAALPIFDKKLIQDIKVINEKFEAARKDPSQIRDTLALMQTMVNESAHPKQFNHTIDHAAWFLLNAAISANDVGLQIDVVNSYVVNLFPKVGPTSGLDDFVKRAVDLAASSRNEALLRNISYAFFNSKTIIDYDKNQWLLESDMLEQSFRVAMLNSLYVTDYLWLSTKVFSNNMEIEKLSPVIANHYTKLLIKALTEKKYPQAIQLSKTYMDKIYPTTGYSEKSTDVISHIIVTSVVAKNAELATQVMTQFVNNTKYNLGSNSILYFNLACYYAIKGDKPKMLESIKSSIQYGHETESFFRDHDFNAFKTDPEFIAAVNSRVKK